MALDMNNFSTDMTEKEAVLQREEAAYRASSAPAESPTATSRLTCISPTWRSWLPVT